MKIFKWYNSDVVYESTKKSIKEVVIEAVNKNANLRDADLVGADLRGADLGGANLGGADLRDANLRDADLVGADLRGADLGGANLGGADLYHVQFYGKGGKTKIKKSQIKQFHEALGIVVED